MALTTQWQHISYRFFLSHSFVFVSIGRDFVFVFVFSNQNQNLNWKATIKWDENVVGFLLFENLLIRKIQEFLHTRLETLIAASNKWVSGMHAFSQFVSFCLWSFQKFLNFFHFCWCRRFRNNLVFFFLCFIYLICKWFESNSILGWNALSLLIGRLYLQWKNTNGLNNSMNIKTNKNFNKKWENVDTSTMCPIIRCFDTFVLFKCNRLIIKCK